MTLKSFAERLGSIIESLQRINISFNLSKASLDAADEFKADYIIDHLQQSVAKLLTIKVHNAEPAEETGTAEPSQTESITGNSDLNEDITSSPDKHKDSSNSETVKSESHAASSSTSDPTVTFLGQVSEGEQITVKVELQDAADEYVEEYAAGDAECMEEEADVLAGGVYLVDDDDEEEKVPTTSKRERPPKSETEQTKSPGLVTIKPKHLVIQIVTCPTCGKGFQSKKSLKEHERRHHEQAFRHHCEICNKGFMSLTSKNSHQLLHVQKRQFRCDICNKEYAHNKNLKEHMLSHDDSKSSWPKCHVCGKPVKPSNYHTHLAVHREPKFQCTLCGKKFKTSSNLPDTKIYVQCMLTIPMRNIKYSFEIVYVLKLTALEYMYVGDEHDIEEPA